MKKILSILIVLIILAIIFAYIPRREIKTKQQTYETKVVVFYPSCNDTIVFKSKNRLVYECEGQATRIYELSGNIIVNSQCIFQTTSPIKVLSKTKE